ncbi:hypothetical protein THAOC_27131 [Thalassiosira oceanica]|uniref:Uncharacterized protein n=1 Tax=Thalassiosira oceanica TaxID=159749 RepID=K0RI91_THAOC|nr:hypothetical protein THAOC_27131 [Thalassiosira oceanica]|eukprot:EJK53438.1 hypothetical protein THAOC_27131 [Thalassiosira oceanica]
MRYASPLLFQAGNGVWAAEVLGEAQVPGNERKAGPPADRAAPCPRSLRLPTPCSEAVKILKMDEDGAPSHPPSDCGKGDASASTAGEKPPPPPGLVAQSGAGQGARTAARDAVLLAVQEAAEASAARGRAPGGAVPKDVPGRATSAMRGGSQTPGATQDGSQTHHAGEEAQLWELSMAFEFAPSRGCLHPLP